MNARSLFASLALAAGLGAAAPVFATTISLVASGPGKATGSVQMAANGLIIDDFAFAPASFAGLVSVSLTNLGGPVTFFDAILFPDTVGELDFSNLTNAVGGTFSFASTVTAALPLTLRVFGAVTDATGNLGGAGSYGVAVTTTAVAAVPEPASFALLVAGLGVIGVVVARRRRAGDRRGPVARAA